MVSRDGKPADDSRQGLKAIPHAVTHHHNDIQELFWENEDDFSTSTPTRRVPVKTELDTKPLQLEPATSRLPLGGRDQASTKPIHGRHVQRGEQYAHCQ